jgi:hypothetical protein
MKITISICGLLCLGLIACNGSDKDEMRASIPGTYVRYSEHEFGKEFDTLVISEKNDQFQILRKWRYERVLDSVKQEPEYKQQVTTASYDSEHRVLNENESGNVISFDAKDKTVSIGPTKYNKLK